MLSQHPSDIMNIRSYLPSDVEIHDQHVSKESRRKHSRQLSMQRNDEEVVVPAPPSYRPPAVEKELKSSSNYVPPGALLSPTKTGLVESPKALNEMVDLFSSSCSSLSEVDPNAADVQDLSGTQDSGTQTT